MSPPIAMQILSSMRVILGEDGTQDGIDLHSIYWYVRCITRMYHVRVQYELMCSQDCIDCV